MAGEREESGEERHARLQGVIWGIDASSETENVL